MTTITTVTDTVLDGIALVRALRGAAEARLDPLLGGDALRYRLLAHQRPEVLVLDLFVDGPVEEYLTLLAEQGLDLGDAVVVAVTDDAPRARAAGAHLCVERGEERDLAAAVFEACARFRESRELVRSIA